MNSHDPARKIKVLVIDDSALVRKLLTMMLEQDPAIEVVGTASDPYIARDKIKRLAPEVLTLDVEMPGMDGLTFLENLMRLHPLPVVMVSSLTSDGADTTLRALELGAVDFFEKPHHDLSETLTVLAPQLAAKIHAAAGSRPRASTLAAPPPKLSADAVLPKRPSFSGIPGDSPVIAIGASTGGTEAIRVVLESMPPDAPPIVITQHIPAAFSAPFAARLDRCSPMRVVQAEDGQHLMPGHAYVAPGDRHLIVIRDGARLVCRLHDGPAVGRHKPSVDVMFRSVAMCTGDRAVGALLTGMGDDGARGLLEMREAGALTVAQDQASSVVWGMPGSAWKMQAASELVSIDQMAARLLALVASMGPHTFAKASDAVRGQG
ncbi:protein-glutamate methylesterase/protein-glutamine glutaminase [Frateuria aurantia]|uniref:Protein-glutamate methylesterase/protein-glutamine glutaminase n=1 Tax=Frateuria aurantia (strain ATCC 33424 / DSM 6220 / KCTC 2777 / LMG 1558 / NBRC 3245 / NCIMB 13370) TaxID=767434 RepID=H8L2R8_FRAAD|nr:chemotaxis response regulator protein-glutamate methylesterase [Frateuria aurantia]AFC86427.1 chemotaxis response regulator containing a CheY-like receiver domain and a methylesterase domain [Frateuria aurantia DSM 6220]